MKTGHQIQTDVYNLLKASTLVSNLSGGIYRKGLRPRDSKLEDLVVIFTTATGEQVQQGVVTLNIYVPDIYPMGNGIPTENVLRCETIEGLVQTEIEGLNAGRSDYLFSLKDAVHTQRDEEIEQSFVVAKLSFRIFQNNTNNQ